MRLPAFAAGLLGAAALTATLLLVRQRWPVRAARSAETVPAGERQPARFSLERIRELGY